MLAVPAVSVLSLEMFWRARGHPATVADTRDLWAYHRSHVYPEREGDDVLVFIGDSRSQLGVSMPELAKRLPRIRPVQLAIAGGRPGDILEDLANDQDFNGRVIVNLTPAEMLQPGVDTRAYVRRFHTTGPIGRFDAWVGSWIQTRLVSHTYPLSLAGLAQTLGERRWPTPPAGTMSLDRAVRWDHRREIDSAAYREWRVARTREFFSVWENRPPSLEEFRDSVAVLNDRIERIRGRGGDVAVVHFPLGSELYAMYDGYFPKEIFWHELETRVSAPTVHFLDWPELCGYSLPDESHLDAADIDVFTEGLVKVLTWSGFFATSEKVNSAADSTHSRFPGYGRSGGPF